MLSFFLRGVLDEILSLIEPVSEGFPSYSYTDYKRLNDLIEQCDLNALFNSSLNIDEACKMFTSTF